MAQVVTTTLTDDIDGGEAHETIAFSFAGKSYEIDLSKENAETLRENFGFYATHARETAGGHTAHRRARRDRAQPAKVRAWAGEQGIVVSERGRIPVDVVAQYEAAGH